MRPTAVSAANLAAGIRRVARQLVDELHDRRDGGVVRLAPPDVVGHLRDRLVRLAGQRRDGRAGTVADRSHLVDEPPQPAQEPCDSLGARGRPLHVLVGRPQEEDVEADGVSAVQAHELVGSLDVALRLRHLRAALQHPALVEDAGERLPEADEPHLVHDLHEEPRVQEVAGRVVDAADVLRDRAPEVGGGTVERSDVRVRVDVAQEVPGGVDERVHRVRLTRARLPALRARHVQPLRVGGEWRHALRPVVLDLGQQHR